MVGNCLLGSGLMEKGQIGNFLMGNSLKRNALIGNSEWLDGEQPVEV